MMEFLVTSLTWRSVLYIKLLFESVMNMHQRWSVTVRILRYASVATIRKRIGRNGSDPVRSELGTRHASLLRAPQGLSVCRTTLMVWLRHWSSSYICTGVVTALSINVRSASSLIHHSLIKPPRSRRFGVWMRHPEPRGRYYRPSPCLVPRSCRVGVVSACRSEMANNSGHVKENQHGHSLDCRNPVLFLKQFVTNRLIFHTSAFLLLCDDLLFVCHVFAERLRTIQLRVLFLFISLAASCSGRLWIFLIFMFCSTASLGVLQGAL